MNFSGGYSAGSYGCCLALSQWVDAVMSAYWNWNPCHLPSGCSIRTTFCQRRESCATRCVVEATLYSRLLLWRRSKGSNPIVSSSLPHGLGLRPSLTLSWGQSGWKSCIVWCLVPAVSWPVAKHPCCWSSVSCGSCGRSANQVSSGSLSRLYWIGNGGLVYQFSSQSGFTDG